MAGLTNSQGQPIDREGRVIETNGNGNGHGAGSGWHVDGGGYSLDQFYTASSDRKGGTAQLRVNFPPHFAAEMAHIVYRHIVPEYRTPHDIVRDAVHHRLEYLGVHLSDPAIMRAVNQNRRLATIERQMMDLEAMQSFLDMVNELYSRGRGLEDREAVRMAVQHIEDELPGMREPWTSRVLKVLDEAKEYLAEGEGDGR